jgi:hypothetical protein
MYGFAVTLKRDKERFEIYYVVLWLEPKGSLYLGSCPYAFVRLCQGRVC